MRLFIKKPVRPSAASFAILPALCASAQLAAAQTETGQTEKTGAGAAGIDYMSSGYLVELVLGLVFVLICILALAWFARRFRHLQSSQAGSMQVLGGISMGARERVVLLQVGSARLLLGVAPGRINTLHVLEQARQADIAGVDGHAPDASAGEFAGRLDAALSQRGTET